MKYVYKLIRPMPETLLGDYYPNIDKVGWYFSKPKTNGSQEYEEKFVKDINDAWVGDTKEYKYTDHYNNFIENGNVLEGTDFNPRRYVKKVFVSIVQK